MNGKRMTPALGLLTASFLFFIFSGVMPPPRSGMASIVPERIIINLTAEPTTSIAVTWRTIGAVNVSSAQFAPGVDRFDSSVKIITVPAAQTSYVLENGKSTHHHSAVLTGLSPSTQYLYRVGGDSVWSEWNYFTTASKGNEGFSFLYLGDAQHGLRTFYPRIIREGFKRNPNVSFLLFTGDLIDRPQYDSLWSEFFDAGDNVHHTVPSVMVPGNHEYGRKDAAGNKQAADSLIGSWKPHFTLPENGVRGLEETSYWFKYQGVLFVMLNGNDRLQEQSVWLEGILSKNAADWTIVTVHQPLYSMSKDRDQRKTRDAFLSIIDRYAVDLILQGHDHVYARSKKLKEGKVSATGTVFVTSNAGSDGYRLNTLYKDLMERYGTNVQLYQAIDVSKRSLKVTAYTAQGTVYDSFTLSNKTNH